MEFDFVGNISGYIAEGRENDKEKGLIWQRLFPAVILAGVLQVIYIQQPDISQ